MHTSRPLREVRWYWRLIMLTVGGYGFLRFSIPITSYASEQLAGVIIAVSLVAIVYIGLVALAQRDMKKLIAYSSIAHMGFVTLGFFVIFALFAKAGSSAELAMQGGMVQMISHGFISGAMFLCVGVLYDRMHSRQIADYGGVVNSMPVFAVFFVIFAHGQCWPAGDLRVCGRVHGHPGKFQCQRVVCLPGRIDPGSRCCLHALDDQAGRIRCPGQRAGGSPDGSEPQGVFLPAGSDPAGSLAPVCGRPPLIEIMDASVVHLLHQAQLTNLR